MAAPEIAQRREMPRHLVIEVNVSQRRHPCIVIRAEGGGERTASFHLNLEGLHQRAPDTATPVLPAHHDRMKLPDAAPVLRQTTHPPKHDFPIDHRAGEALADD